MKRSNLIFLVLVVTAISFSSCQKECTTPQQTNFTGTSTWVKDMDPGTTEALESGKVLITGQVAEWYESANITEVTGQSFWTVNWLIDPDFTSAKLWGTSIINVGVENQGDPVLGKWEMIWNGTLSNAVFDPEAGFFTQGLIAVDAVGTGVSGSVDGISAHWTYTMDISKGFVYAFEGYIK